jgi:hypothetical protein
MQCEAIRLVHKPSKNSDYLFGVAKVVKQVKWGSTDYYYTFSGWMGRTMKWSYVGGYWNVNNTVPGILLEKLDEGYTYVPTSKISEFPGFKDHFEKQTMVAFMDGRFGHPDE